MGIRVTHSPYAFGIDLGTTNSAIGVSIRNKPTIIPIDGRLTLPSVVSLRTNGELIVGWPAKANMLVYPDSTVASAKREIGSNWTKELGGKSYTATDIASEILTALVAKAQAQSDIDLQGTPHKVVICIPAIFTEDQKRATIEAAEMANLEVLTLLEEPVAAAIAYAIDRNTSQTILVYDMGGGTFDVSILEVKSDQGESADLRILAKEGIPKLGGDDFDRLLMQIAAEQFQTQTSIDMLDLQKDQGISTKLLREAQQKLKEAAERAKISLTETSVAEINIPNLLVDESGNQHSLEMEVTREQFETAVVGLILTSKEAVEKALTSAGLTIEDISRIILVGGSTRVPLIARTLTELFGREPFRDDDPDTVVARGAAIVGAQLISVDSGEAIGGDIRIHDKVSHHLGIETRGGKFSCIIEKNTDIPETEALVSIREFTTPADNMTDLRIGVYQADREIEYVSSEGITCIGEFFLSGIPAKPRGVEKISVQFAIDKQNLLTVTASSSGSAKALEIKRKGDPK